jgi:Ca-activated chloride channel homolog
MSMQCNPRVFLLLGTTGFLGALVLFMFTGGLDAQGPAAAKSVGDADAFRVSVNVDLVAVQATVTDRHGHGVGQLQRDDFQVFDDGKPAMIRVFRHEDTPVTVGLVIDHSGSMREKIADVTTAARAFVKSSNPHDQMFVMNFNDTVLQGLPRGIRFSDSAAQLGDAIGRAPAAGRTALYDAILKSLAFLREGSSEKKVLVVISDGGDNSSEATLAQVLKATEESSAMIYTIGVFDEGDPDRNPKVLRRLAGETGGEAFFPERLAEIEAICERIARDIRDQYTIGYSAAVQAQPGQYHKIRITAAAEGKGKLSVRARPGYRTGEAAK